MKVTVKEEPNWKRILDIEIPVEDIDKEFQNQLTEYRSQAKIPGFRPGKAPMDVVKSRFIDSIKADVMETLIPRAYDEAVRQEKLNPMDQPQLSNVVYDDGKPLTFTAEFETRPVIEPKEYTGFKLEMKVKEVSDADIDEVLKDLQQRYAELKPVERKCHADDYVVVDLVKKFDKLNKLKDDKMENVEVDLAGEQVLKEFKEGITGMGVGEMKEIEVNYPEDYMEKDLAGDTIRYLVIVKEVKEKELPELNDEFAKTNANLESFDELKKTVRENLENRAKEDAEISVKSEIIKGVVGNNQFDVPRSLIENYMKSVTEDFKKRYKDVDENKIRESYQAVGEDTIRWQFLFHEIARKEELKVAEEERAEWIKQFAGSYNMSEQTARETLGKAGKFEEIDDSLLERKVLDFIKSKSNVTT